MKTVNSIQQLKGLIMEMSKSCDIVEEDLPSGIKYTSVLDIPIKIGDSPHYLVYEVCQESREILLRRAIYEGPDISRSIYLSYVEEKKIVYSFVEDYIKSNGVVIDYQSIFYQLNTEIYGYYKNHPSLKFERYLHRIITMRRESQGTLCIGYNPIKRRYELIYNAEFCIISTIVYFLTTIINSCNERRKYIKHLSTEDVISPLLYLLTHEFYHVIYNHVTENSLYNLEGNYIQLYGDAYINNIIPYLPSQDTVYTIYRYTHMPPSQSYTTAHHPLGITKGVSHSMYKESLNIEELDEKILNILSTYMNISKTNFPTIDNPIVETYSGQDLKLLIHTGNLFNTISLQYKSMIASSTFINMCKELELCIQSDKSEELSGDPGEQNVALGSPGDSPYENINESLSTPSGNGKRETPQDKMIKESLLKSIIEKAITDVSEYNDDDSKNKGEGVGGVLGILKDSSEDKNLGIDLEDLTSNVSKSKWKSLFKEKIKVASGYDFTRTNSLPSRKVEGLWGARKKIPALKHVAILLDCSGSMGSPEFGAIFSELKSFINYPEFKDVIVHLICWGSSASYKRYRGLSINTINQMYKEGNISLGTTYPLEGYELMMNKVPNPDLVLFLSDCEFSSRIDLKNHDSKLATYVKKVARKTVYVSVNRSESSKLKPLDPVYERRLIELSPKQAREYNI